METLKNSALFSNLTETERLFLDPDGTPWGSIQALPDVFLDQERLLSHWPRLHDLKPHELNCHRGNIKLEGSAQLWGGKDLQSDDNCLIGGPIVFGRNVVIRRSAVITGPCFIGDNVLIGHGCRIKHAIIRSGVKVEFNTRLVFSTVGRNVRIGSGAVFDDDPIPVDIAEQYPGLTACGVAIGDGSRIGGGAIFAPGAAIAPGVNIKMGTRNERRDSEDTLRALIWF